MNMSVEQFNMRIKKLTQWAGDNSGTVESYRSLAAIIVGLLCMFIAYQIGNAHFHLILEGVKAQGRIVDHKQYSSSTKGPTSISYIPIVEFQIENRIVRFTDWKGSQSTSLDPVPIIYNSDDPSEAMIDRPIWNWMPWAPIFFAGLFLVLVSIKNWLKFSRAKPYGQLNELKARLPELRLPEPELPDLDDPIARKVSWDPAKLGGANFRTQKMKVSGNQIVIERTGSAILFCLFFALLGLVGQVAGGLLIFLNSELAGGVFMIVLGVLFDVVAALLLILIGNRKVIFDKLAGVYFRGKAFDHSTSSHRSQQGRLADIHAIQLVNEKIRSNPANGDLSTYTSYEMNLVFKDGDRLNVMDHGIEKDIEESARQLGSYLGVPIWRQLSETGSNGSWNGKRV